MSSKNVIKNPQQKQQFLRENVKSWLIFNIFSGYVLCACMCIYTPCVCRILRRSKRTSDSLDLKLGGVMSCHIGWGRGGGAGNRTLSSARAGNTVSLLSTTNQLTLKDKDKSDHSEKVA